LTDLKLNLAGFWTLSDFKTMFLDQGSQTRGPRGYFVRPAMFIGKFQIINI